MEVVGGERYSSAWMDDFLRKSGGVAVIDGGLATELERHGADLNDTLWSGKCLLTSPHLIRRVCMEDNTTALLPSSDEQEEWLKNPAPELDLPAAEGAKSLNSRCLLGEILTKREERTQGLPALFHSIWKLKGEFRVSAKGGNVFAFIFDEEVDCNRVWEGAPWTVRSKLMVLRRFEPDLDPSQMQFSSTPIWVQITGVPMEKMTKNNAEDIGALIGTVIYVDAGNNEEVIISPFLRVRVQFDLQNPLPQGFFMKRKEKASIWIRFQYEKLGEYCYRCGRIGHDQLECKSLKQKEALNHGYEPSLRTTERRRFHTKFPDQGAGITRFQSHEDKNLGSNKSKAPSEKTVDNNGGQGSCSPESGIHAPVTDKARGKMPQNITADSEQGVQYGLGTPGIGSLVKVKNLQKQREY